MSTPTPLPDEIEQAIPRPSSEPWERRLLRLVEPSRVKPLPSEAEPEGRSEPTTVHEAEEAVRAAHTSAEYDAAVKTLARLRSRPVEAPEPARTPPAAIPPPKTRPVLHRKILERDSAGRMSRLKEWIVEEPLLDAASPGNRSTELPGAV